MSDLFRVKFKKLTETAIIPKRQHPGDAGFDLYADQSCEIFTGGQAVISTGIAAAIPEYHVGMIWPRSGMAVKYMTNVHAGIIDSNYRGEIRVCLINHGERPVEIRKGDRIAQLVVTTYLGAADEVDVLDDTARGEQGFGSTGV